MTLCPIALVASCEKCPLFIKVCPLKSVIGDYKKPDETQISQHKENAPNDERQE